MARPGVTYQDISNAAAELQGQGQTVTIENIRGLLGTGSIGTINKYLRQWRDIQNSTLNHFSEDNMPDELVSVLKGLWDRVLTQSAEQFVTVENECRDEIVALKQEVEKYKTNNRRWQKLFNRWNQEKVLLDKEKLTLEQALHFSHKENAEMAIKHDSLCQQIQEKHERIYELNRLHKQAQENHEHFRESSREERLLEQQKFEQERQQYLSDIKRQNDELVFQKEQWTELQGEHKILQKTHQTLESTNQQTQSKLDHLFETLKETEKVKAILEKNVEHWKAEAESLKKQFKVKLEQVSEFQSQNKWLNQQLSEVKSQLDNLKDDNKQLTNEKWMLVQEKARLEGQLKRTIKEMAT